MNDQQLERTLQSVGMACFVKYFHEFANRSLPNDAVAGLLLERETYTEDSCRTRVSKARSIIDAGCAQHALVMIAEAERVDAGARRQAEALAKELSGR